MLIKKKKKRLPKDIYSFVEENILPTRHETCKKNDRLLVIW